VKKEKVALAIMGLMWLLLLGTPSPGAAQYLGETTWTVSLTQDEHGAKTETLSMTGAITRMGGAYYAMQGYVNVPNDGPVILAGSGVLIGEYLYLNLTSTQYHPDNWRNTGVVQVQMNRSNLNATFYEVGNSFDLGSIGPSPTFGSYFTVGSLTRTGPLLVLNPYTGGSTSLLLMD
jgi:hypothetical protein